MRPGGFVGVMPENLGISDGGCRGETRLLLTMAIRRIAKARDVQCNAGVQPGAKRTSP